MTIATMPTRTFLLLSSWISGVRSGRTGEAFPPTCGGRGEDTHDPKYNGYSVGRWEDDYTFVVDTTGMAPETWATRAGYPHSVEARVHGTLSPAQQTRYDADDDDG